MSPEQVEYTEGEVSQVTDFQGPCSSASGQHLPVLCRILTLTSVLFLEPWGGGDTVP